MRLNKMKKIWGALRLQSRFHKRDFAYMDIGSRVMQGSITDNIARF